MVKTRKARLVKKSRKSSKSRKLSKGASKWNQHMMKVYREMKAKDSSVRLGDAMKAARKTYRS
jgi:hypothetical protein